MLSILMLTYLVVGVYYSSFCYDFKLGNWSLMNFTILCRAMKGKRTSHSTLFQSWSLSYPCWLMNSNALVVFDPSVTAFVASLLMVGEFKWFSTQWRESETVLVYCCCRR